MRKRATPPPSANNSNAWMSTFSDLLMLMLTFFVLLLTMSSLDAKKVRELARSGVHPVPSSNKNSAFELQEHESPPMIAKMVAPLGGFTSGAEKRKVVGELMEAILQESEIKSSAWVEVRPFGVVVNLEGQGTFEKGSSVLTPAAKRFIASFSEVAKHSEADVVVESHVLAKGDFSEQGEAWELALMRMDRAAVEVEAGGVRGERLRVSGMGTKLGSEEQRFVQSSEIVRFSLVIGEFGAEPR